MEDTKIDKNKFKRNFYTNDDSGKVYLISLLTPIIFALLLSLLGGWIANMIGVDYTQLSKETWFIILAHIISPLSFILIFFVYNKFAKVSFTASSFKWKIGWKNFCLAVFVAIVALFGIQYFISIIDFLLEKIGFTLSSTTLPNDNLAWLLLNILLLAILPGITEELIFRGIILQGLRRNFSDWIAILLSAVMFSVMHGNLQQFIYPFFLGLIFGWLVVRSGNLLLSIVAHFLNNFIVVVLDFLHNTTSFDINLPFSWWSILISVLLLLVTGVILYLVDRFYFKTKKNAFEQSKKEKVKIPSLFLIISWIVGLILLILNTIVNFISK